MTRKAWASDSTGSLVSNNHFNGVSPLGGLISSASTALSVIFPCFSVMRPLRRLNGSADHPNAEVKFALGDVVNTMIGCTNGETIMLCHDTSLPRPYSLGFRVQGTEGLWMDVNKSIYLEGKSPQPHRWEPAEGWFAKYDHPLWKRYADLAAGAGHGGMDWFVIHAFVEALKAKAPMPIDIYDALAWSAITPLSEQSIAEGNRTLDFPDFTRGQWRTRKPIFALNDAY